MRLFLPAAKVPSQENKTGGSVLNKPVFLLPLRTTILLIGLCLFSFTAEAALPQMDSQGQSLPTLAPMLEKVTPAVVNIASTGRIRVQQNPLFNDPFFRRFFNVPNQPRERITQSLGSGVIVDAEKGYILTNNHVIARAEEITVTLQDGSSHHARLLGTDPDTDVAIIQIDADNITAIPMADSDKVRVGDFSLAIGNPFGLGQTVTSGIVSAIGRSGLGIEGFEDFIQTDASINPGNSGGALVNLRGELVGINTAILSQSGGNIGIGFAIPINMARDIMQQLLSHGEVRRGQLGAQAQDLTPQLAQAFAIKSHRGAVITRIENNSAADRAGLRPGDIVLEINGRQIRDASTLRNRVGLLRVGENVSMKVMRDNKILTLNAKVEATPQHILEGQQLHARLSGAILSDIERGSRLYGRIQGVLVADIKMGSPASRAGLRKGDIITTLNRKPVHSLQELKQSSLTSRSLLLNIVRGNSALFLYLQ
ncbi:MAG TPA: DegQ family serine endoprotease [Gammaproteobacteria bacterium]|nr:DegQ family serine endoprotease [Gammaproteobacteria bacterium]